MGWPFCRNICHFILLETEVRGHFHFADFEVQKGAVMLEKGTFEPGRPC